MGFRWTGGRAARQGREVLRVIALIAGWLASVPAWAATVQSVAIRDGRIVIRFDEAVGDAASRVLTGPRQIAVDVSGATPGREITARGLVTGVTQMRSGRSGMRMVFDLAEPAIVTDGGFDSDGRELT